MKTDGTEYHVKSIKEVLAQPPTTNITTSHQVEKFISNEISPDERAGLYDKYLDVRPFNSKDRLPASETALKEGYGVFAKENIPANTCIGVHGGTVLFMKKGNDTGNLSSEDLDSYPYQRFLFALDDKEKCLLDSKNAMSKINSRHALVNGKLKEGSGKNNAECIIFNCEMADKKQLKLYAIYTNENIKKGEEIFSNSGYNNIIVEMIMQTNKKK